MVPLVLSAMRTRLVEQTYTFHEPSVQEERFNSGCHVRSYGDMEKATKAWMLHGIESMHVHMHPAVDVCVLAPRRRPVSVQAVATCCVPYMQLAKGRAVSWHGSMSCFIGCASSFAEPSLCNRSLWRCGIDARSNRHESLVGSCVQH
jgi:hypothetical protein